MLKLLILALVGACAAQNNYHVTIEYKAPNLRLFLPDTHKDISSVLFIYTVHGMRHAVKSSKTDDGFEYKTQITGGPVDSIWAYADLTLNNDMEVITARTTYTSANQGEVAIPGARRLRAVVFRDDFTSFNRLDWITEVSMFGGRNWEFQVYTNDPKNVYTKDGKLFLHPTLTADDPRFSEDFLKNGVMDLTEIFGMCTNNADYGCARDAKNGMLPPIMSGKVSSEATVKFGTVEVKAKIPKGDWLWPAIWMMPKKSVYGTWPRSGEIDIMETRGNSGPLGVGTVSSTLHWGPAWNINKWDLTHGEKTATSWHDDWHIWKLEWTTDHIKTTVDGQEILTVPAGDGFWKKGGFTGDDIWASGTKMAPFDQDFYVILNVAVGGTNGYFSDTANWGVKKPWANNSPHANLDFWNAKSDWLPTWQGDNVALQVEYVELSN